MLGTVCLGGSLEPCSSGEHCVGSPLGQHSIKWLWKWEWGAQELNYLERVNYLGCWLGGDSLSLLTSINPVSSGSSLFI